MRHIIALLVAASVFAAASAYAQLTTLKVGGPISHGPPPACDGTIDLSTGCTQPMLGH
jgi:hypothetical protein